MLSRSRVELLGLSCIILADDFVDAIMLLRVHFHMVE